MPKISYNGEEWNLDYFITATEFFESNLGDNPSKERIERVRKRYQAIEELQSSSTKKEVEAMEETKPKTKRGKKNADKEESVPDRPEG